MTIRPWTAADADQLRILVLAYLGEVSEAGGDFLPTMNNVERFIERGLGAAAIGDPVLVAEDDGRLQAFCLWVGVPDQGFDLAAKVCHALGTYVAPPFRRQRVSCRLREKAKRVARGRGYTRVDGVALDERGFAAGHAAGGVDAGLVVRLDLKKE